MKRKNVSLIVLSIILVIIMLIDFRFMDEVKKKVGKISINNNYDYNLH